MCKSESSNFDSRHMIKSFVGIKCICLASILSFSLWLLSVDAQKDSPCKDYDRKGTKSSDAVLEESSARDRCCIHLIKFRSRFVCLVVWPVCCFVFQRDCSFFVWGLLRKIRCLLPHSFFSWFVLVLSVHSIFSIFIDGVFPLRSDSLY